MPQTSIELSWADGVYTFRLGLAQINEIQNRCGPIGEVNARLLTGRYYRNSPEGEIVVGNPAEARYRLEDVLTVIRQGLLGGGKAVVDGSDVKVDAARVSQLMENYVFPAEGCPLKDAWALAAAILHPAIEGYDPPEVVEDEPKKKEAEAKASTTDKS